MNDHVRSSAFLKADQIFEHSARLKILPFPSPNPPLFATFICAVCEKLKARMSSLDAGDRETTLIPIFLVDQIAPTLRFIEGASSENTPASLVVPVERIGEAVLPGSKFMVRRQWGYNYSVRELRRRLEEDLKGLLPDAEHTTLFKTLPERLFAISFPSFERDNALLHVNFAHEIAHPLERAYLTQEDQTGVLQELRNEVERVIAEKDPVRRVTEIGANVGYAARMRQAALMEVLSDTIAAHVFGPSALFALHEVATLSRSMDKISADLHPPWRFRLRHILKVLEELDFLDASTFQLRGWPKEIPASISHVRGKVDAWLYDLHHITELTTDIDEINQGFPQKQAYDSAERALPAVQKFATESVAQRYTPTLFSEEVPGLLERLHASLPPNRIECTLTNNRDVSLASILASGWLFKLGELAPLFSQDRHAYVQRVQTLNRLVLKAIQLSEIQTEYAKRPRKQDNGTAKQA
jgi:hypothetical protein